MFPQAPSSAVYLPDHFLGADLDMPQPLGRPHHFEFGNIIFRHRQIQTGPRQGLNRAIKQSPRARITIKHDTLGIQNQNAILSDFDDVMKVWGIVFHGYALVPLLKLVGQLTRFISLPRSRRNYLCFAAFTREIGNRSIYKNESRLLYWRQESDR